jgi:HAD superfamily hydrolase (TIGR01509 family)
MMAALGRLVKDPSVLSGMEEQIRRRNAAVQEMCVIAPPIHKATIELLLSLKGYRLGLVTTSSRADVEPVLRAAGVLQCFDAMVFGGDVEHPKPAPDPYLLAGKLLGVTTGLVFEDSDAGIASARQAGFVVIPIADPVQLPDIVHRAIHGKLDLFGARIRQTGENATAIPDEG